MGFPYKFIGFPGKFLLSQTNGFLNCSLGVVFRFFEVTASKSGLEAIKEAEGDSQVGFFLAKFRPNLEPIFTLKYFKVQYFKVR